MVTSFSFRRTNLNTGSKFDFHYEYWGINKFYVEIFNLHHRIWIMRPNMNYMAKFDLNNHNVGRVHIQSWVVLYVCITITLFQQPVRHRCTSWLDHNLESLRNVLAEPMGPVSLSWFVWIATISTGVRDCIKW